MNKLYYYYHFYVKRMYWKFKELNLKDQIIIYLSSLLNGIGYGLTYLAIVKEGLSLWIFFPIITNLATTHQIYKTINLCFIRLMSDPWDLVFNYLKNNENDNK